MFTVDITSDNLVKVRHHWTTYSDECGQDYVVQIRRINLHFYNKRSSGLESKGLVVGFNAPCSCNDLFTFLSQNPVPTPIVSFLTDAQYSKHFQRFGKWSYVFLEWIATYINREEKTKINLFTSFFFWCILTLTLLHPFKSRIHFRREQYRNPVLNSATNP